MSAALPVRMVVTVLWPLALVGWIFALAGPLGFSLLDDGYIASQSHRLLHGAVPHAELISPRPLGTAFVHMLDFALPLPLFTSVRLVPVVQLVLYSILFAAVLYRRPPWRWTMLQSLGAALSALVNLHAFPLTSWYTIDGLTLIAIGFYLLQTGTSRASRRRQYCGLLALGIAVVFKQSFVLAPLLGIAYLALLHRDRERRELLRETAVGTAIGAAPCLAYGIVVAALGGFEPMLEQFAHARAVYGASLLTSFAGRGQVRPGDALGASTWMIVGVVAVAAAAFLAPMAARRAPLGAAGAVAAVITLVVWLPLREHLGYGGTWGLQLTWVVLALVLVTYLRERRLDKAGVALLAVAYMTILSWGYPVPNLIAGTLALFAVERVAGLTAPALSARGPARALVTVAALGATVAVVLGFSDARDRFPYFDRPADQLTAKLDRYSPEFGSIRTNPVTATYIGQLTSCVRSHPARWSAVLPDNSSLYRVLGMRNPFPIDWMYAPDYQGSEERIAAAARALDRRGHFLVLFQTFPAGDLSHLRRVPRATVASRPFLYQPALRNRIVSSLHGRRLACGSFVGVYRPG